MAKRFTKTSINWIELEKRIPPDQKSNFYAFKGKADAYLRRVLTNSPEPPKINWDEYKTIVPIPGLVDKFKSEYERFKVPYPQDTMTAKVDEQWKGLEPKIKKYCVEMQKEIDKASKELARIKAHPKFEEVTMEMVHELYPRCVFDPVKNPTFWPHTPDEQLGYEPPIPVTPPKGQ